MSTTTAESTAERKSWRDADPSALIAHILETHHRYTKDELGRLQSLMESVRKLYEARHPELILVSSLLARLCADLLPHMQKEETILFPFIEALEHGTTPPFGPPSVAMPIRVLSLEHEAAAGILSELRCVTSGYNVPEDACVSYRALLDGLQNLEADLEEHIHLETNVLFPKALAMEAQ